MGPFRLSLRLLQASLQVQWRYRLNLTIRLLAVFLVTFAEFVGIWIMVSRFGPLRGWSPMAFTLKTAAKYALTRASKNFAGPHGPCCALSCHP